MILEEKEAKEIKEKQNMYTTCFKSFDTFFPLQILGEVKDEVMMSPLIA